MDLGPFLKRELTTSVRSSRAFVDRRYVMGVMALLVVGTFLLWDWRGLDRSSPANAQRFGLVLFSLVVTGMVCLAVSFIIPQVALAIASERNRKTLDALLASRFSSAQIVVGAMAAGLFRFANAGLAGLPVVVLVVFLGGVPTPWVILAALGLVSWSFFVAAISALASTIAPTGAYAMAIAVGRLLTLSLVPSFFVLFRPILWPGAPNWLTTTAIWTVDGSPMGLVINFSGIVPRPGGPVGAVARLMAWELVGGLVLVAWAIVRLRPHSRGLYDVDGEATRIKRLRATLKRPPRRPTCFDNPVLWYEIYSTVGITTFRRWFNQGFALLGLAVLAWMTWDFAKPAFDELQVRGYHPSPEAFQAPELQPVNRLLINKLFKSLATTAAPGQARLEFNIILRQFTGLGLTCLLLMVVNLTFESIKGEQRRDTWLGLITTPMTGGEILKAKTLGTFWKTRGLVLTMLGLWSVALATGAVHPFGMLAELVFLAIAATFYAAIGLWLGLLTSHPERPRGNLKVSVGYLSVLLVGNLILVLAPAAFSWTALLTYEDVQALIQGGPFPEFHDQGSLYAIVGARSVAGLWLVGIASLSLGAYRLTRANARNFDEAIGRPVQSQPDQTSDVSQR